nr:hypothetical protein [Tanacetum cinerariifolium]
MLREGAPYGHLIASCSWSGIRFRWESSNTHVSIVNFVDLDGSEHATVINSWCKQPWIKSALMEMGLHAPDHYISKLQ